MHSRYTCISWELNLFRHAVPVWTKTTVGTNMEIELMNDGSSNSVEICTTFRWVSTFCVGVLITSHFRKSIRHRKIAQSKSRTHSKWWKLWVRPHGFLELTTMDLIMDYNERSFPASHHPPSQKNTLARADINSLRSGCCNSPSTKV